MTTITTDPTTDLDAIITREDQRLAALRDEAASALASADRDLEALIASKIQGQPEAKQAPLGARATASRVGAEAAQIAASRQEAAVERIRRDAEDARHRAAIDAVESAADAARARYAAAYERLEASARDLQDSLTVLADARQAERTAAMQLARFAGQPHQHEEYTRLPQLGGGSLLPRPPSALKPFHNPHGRLERFLEAHRPHPSVRTGGR